jgi:hypothetical protein
VTLRTEGQGNHELVEGDACVVPPGMKTALSDCSDDLQWLEVALPGEFETRAHPEAQLS